MSKQITFTREDIDAAFATKPAMPASSPRATKRSKQSVENSIPAPIERGPARKERWVPIPVTQLPPARPVDWVWEEFIAKGYVTLFTAMWKSGKSTLLAHLLRDLAVGGRLAPHHPGKVVVVSEERADIWRAREQDLGLKDNLELICQPFLNKPSWSDWADFLDSLRGRVDAYGYSLVVLDTISSLWPVWDENDAPQVTAALMPLRALCASGAGVLLVHHPRKGTGEELHSSRGSGALPSFADALLDMRRFAPAEIHDRRRILTTLSRLNTDPLEVVVELTEDGYVMVGDRGATTKSDRLDVIAKILQTDGQGLTLQEVLEGWPTNVKPGVRTLDGDLTEGVLAGRFEKLGEGKRGSPFRFRQSSKSLSRSDPLLSARNESGVPGGDK